MRPKEVREQVGPAFANVPGVFGATERVEDDVPWDGSSDLAIEGEVPEAVLARERRRQMVGEAFAVLLRVIHSVVARHRQSASQNRSLFLESQCLIKFVNCIGIRGETRSLRAPLSPKVLIHRDGQAGLRLTRRKEFSEARETNRALIVLSVSHRKWVGARAG